MEHQLDLTTEQEHSTSTVNISVSSTTAESVAHATTLPIHVLTTENGTVISTLNGNGELASVKLEHRSHTSGVSSDHDFANATVAASESPVVSVEPSASIDMFSSKEITKTDLVSTSTHLTATVNIKSEMASEANGFYAPATSATIPVVISGAGMGSGVLSSVPEKSDLSPSTLSAPLMTETAVLVETPRGLMLSVGDEVRAVTYSSLADGEDAQGGHLLSIGNNCIPVALLSQCQQAGLIGEQGEGLVFESREEAVAEGDQGVNVQQEPVMCTTDLPIVTQQVLAVSTPEGEEPKKKNRGWPKGKKRKAAPEVTGPRAPMTGYVIFAINRRQQIKQTHPQLPFTEVTKILGQEWSCMPSDKKQKYLDEAELDKQRYIEELKEFQKSEAYQTLVKKKQLKGGESADDGFGVHTDLEDDDELHCRVCNLYFSSMHNKKEHLFGRQHLQAITDQLEKELKKQQKEQELQAQQQDAQLSASTDLNSSHDGLQSELVDHVEPSKPVDLSSFIEEFVQKNYERDQEIQTLRRILRRDVQENWRICKQVQELKDLENKLRQEVKTQSAHTSNLSSQINSLKSVPALFGVVEF